MKPSVRILPFLFALALLCWVSLVSPDAAAQAMAQPPSTVTVTAPPGGLPVTGSVSATLAGTPTVAVTGTVPVEGAVTATIEGTPSVAITGTPNVTATIAGTPTVGVSGTVQVAAPDGVTVTNKVDANVTAAPGTFLPVAGDVSGARLEVSVPAGVALVGTPTVNVGNVPTVALQNGTQVGLTSTALSTLTAATTKGTCTYVVGDPNATIGTTPTNIPALPLADRTAIRVWNESTATATHMLCNPTGTATTSAAVRIHGGGNWEKWEGLAPGAVVSCRCVSGSCGINFQEERCYQ